jgi:outer membrane protein assembly factor BamB
VVLVLLLAGLSGACFAAAAENREPGQWPQWRGPEGLGVTSDSNLPEQWSSDSDNIKWKTMIPGAGYSSPIVSGGRVFVTTAYEDAAPGIIRRVVAIATGFLVVIFLIAILTHIALHFRRGQSGPGQARRNTLGRTLSWIVAGVSTGVFFLALVMLFVFPDQYDATAGQFLAKAFGTYDTEHVFYVNKEAAAATWLNTGAVALLGLAASLCWVRAHSIWRLIGGFALVPLSVAFVVLTPPDAWKYTVVLWTRVLFVFPGALVATWHLLGYLELRRADGEDATDASSEKASVFESLNNMRISWKHSNIWRFGSGLSVVLFISMALLAILAFVPVNFLLPNRGMHRAVVCLDFETGEILWQTRVFTSPAERKHRENSYATPTPAADGERVIAAFGVGVVCLDFDGRVVWKVLDPKYPGDTRYGATSSVLLWRDRAIILQESEENTKRTTWLAAFDKTSGDVLWKIKPGGLHMAYTTGLLYEDAGGVKLIVASFGRMFCFDLEAGRLLWEHEIPMKQLVAGFARAGAVICIGGGTWGPSGLVALKVNGPGQNPPVEELWQSSEDTPGCASPIIYNDILFTITDTGTMCAYDAASGSLHWRERLRGRHLASLVAGEGKVYACSTSGWTTIVSAEPELRILGRNRLQGDCRASIAVADSHFLVRTSEFLYCIAP